MNGGGNKLIMGRNYNTIKKSLETMKGARYNPVNEGELNKEIEIETISTQEILNKIKNGGYEYNAKNNLKELENLAKKETNNEQ